MARGKTIRIYLADGTASGIRHAEVVNWTGQAMVCPRGRLAELGEWGESQRPGLYILVGDEGDGSRDRAYIGEAENVFERLKGHLANKDFWTRVVFITSKDENLTKVHVKYLESRMIELAKGAERYSLENVTAPQVPSLPRGERDAMEDFLGPVALLLSALGFPILEPLGKRATVVSGDSFPELRLVVPKRGVDARGTVRDDGFVVYAGSFGSAVVGESLLGRGIANRDRLLREGDLRLEGDRLLVEKDILFSSPSAAASILTGSAANGRELWRTDPGVTLKEFEEALVRR